ncbi:hypothetical protein RB195_009915 [Necator americanus]|uniref:Uncharacterized protein n=1 Tax=Necator americanus TaxID=51031 RepID=A0ABR1CWR5_NECAM
MTQEFEPVGPALPYFIPLPPGAPSRRGWELCKLSGSLVEVVASICKGVRKRSNTMPRPYRNVTRYFGCGAGFVVHPYVADFVDFREILSPYPAFLCLRPQRRKWHHQLLLTNISHGCESELDAFYEELELVVRSEKSYKFVVGDSDANLGTAT